jgi:SAM-dependent methyltransferase
MAWWETFFDEKYPKLIPLDPERSQRQAEGVVKMLGLEPPAKILDLCCGYGRHAVPLAQMGYRVTGLDLSPVLLTDARHAAEKAGVDIVFHRGDMREIPWQEEFDGCVMLGGSFGVFEEEADNERVLQGVAKALKHGGRFVLDVANRDSIMRDFRARTWWKRGDLVVWVENVFDPVAGAIHGIWSWREGDEEGERHSWIRIYTATEISAMLRRAGLEPIIFYGGYDLSEFTIDTRIIVVAEKKE